MNPPQEGEAASPVQLQIVEGPQAGTELDVAGQAVIGRSSEKADLILDDLEASRRHASLTPEGETLTIEDLGSTNGTFVNGVAISGQRILVDGDRLRIGKTVLKVRLAPTPELAEAGLADEVEPAVFEVQEEAKPDVAEPAPEEPTEPEEPEEPTEPEGPPPTEQPPSVEAGDAARATATAKLLHTRVADCFKAVLRAWSNRDADAMKRYVSQDFLERARAAWEKLDREFKMNCIEDLELRDVAVGQLSGDGARAEPAHAYVAFLARDWIEDLRTREVVEGDSAKPHAFTERWTFVPEGRRGWVIHGVESLSTRPAKKTAANEWSGLPSGWYSRRDRPSTWRHWDGSAWSADKKKGSRARSRGPRG